MAIINLEQFMPEFTEIDLRPIEQPEENVLSFKKPIVHQEQLKQGSPSKPRRITRAQIIDKFNTKRTRVKLSPSVCNVCAFDIAAAKHGDWDGVPERSKQDVLEALELHKKEFHPVKEDLIIFEDEMPTEWLGTGKTL